MAPIAAGGEAGNTVKGVDTEVRFDTVFRSVVTTWGDRRAKTAVSATAVIPATIPNVTSLSRGELCRNPKRKERHADKT